MQWNAGCLVLGWLLAVGLLWGCGDNGDSAPDASDLSVTLDEDTPIEIVLPASDPGGDALTYEVVVQPSHGELTGSGAVVTYTPELDYHGPDTFSFRASDGRRTSRIATVSLTVTSVEDAPRGVAAAVTTEEDTAVTFTLEGSDPDGEAVSFEVVAEPGNGSIEATSLPTITYTPDPDFAGDDTLTFRVKNSLEGEPATVTVTVTPTPDPPAALAQSVQTEEDTAVAITLTGEDPDGDALDFRIVSAPAHGQLTASRLPEVTYTPATDYAGDDTFTFLVSDGRFNSEPATVTITMTPTNDPPVVTDVVAEATEDNPLVLELPARDPDTAEEALVFRLLGLPQDGELRTELGEPALTAADLPLTLEDNTIVYVPPPDFFSPGVPPAPDTFDFDVSDEEWTTAGTASVVVLEGGLIYVSTEGDDQADGRTPETSLRSLRAALAAIDPVTDFGVPDEIVIADGRYCEADLEIAYSVSIVGSDREFVTLDGSANDVTCAGLRTDDTWDTLLERCEARIGAGWPTTGVFHVTTDPEAPLRVELADLTIANGLNMGPGGAIYSTDELNLEGVRLLDNCSFSFGGGLANQRPEEVADGAVLSDWGSAVLIGCELIGNASYLGGGVASFGALGLQGTVMTDNEAFATDPLPDGLEAAGLGGGVFAVGEGAEAPWDQVTLRAGSVVEANRAYNNGGGLYVDGSGITINDSTVSRNEAGVGAPDGEGGGLFALGEVGQTLTIVHSYFERNDAPSYGGIFAFAYDVSIGDSGINNNTVDEDYAGATFVGVTGVLGQLLTTLEILEDTQFRGNDAGRHAAGLTLRTLDATLTGVDLLGNIARGVGGGLNVEGATVWLEDVVISGNEAGSGAGMSVEGEAAVELHDSAVTENTAHRLGGGSYQTAGLVALYGTTVSGNFALPEGTDNDVQRGGGMAAEGGAVLLDASFVLDNVSADWGGGIYSRYAAVTIQNGSIVGGNTVDSGGGEIDLRDGSLPSGAGLYGADTNIVINDSTVDTNVSEVRGGGVFVANCDLDVARSVFSANAARAGEDSGALGDVQRGGGFYLDESLFHLVDSTLVANRAADQGGGLYVDASTGKLVGVTLTGNTAVADGDPSGDAFNEGGAVYSNDSILGVINSTISGNYADLGGGAIGSEDSNIDVIYATIYDNHSGAGEGALSAGEGTHWVFHGAVIAFNTGGSDCDIVPPDSVHSLDSDDTCGLGEDDLEEDDPGLEDHLAGNGGFTWTHNVRSASPLIDVVPAEECTGILEFYLHDIIPDTHVDQRGEGWPRPVDGNGVGGARCDAGAVEYQ